MGQGRGGGGERGGGAGRGRGRGPGRMGGPKAAGSGGNCVCPNCGHREPHTVRQPFLNSKDDQVTMKSLPKLQARFPQARVHLFEEGGHHTFMLFPEAYAGTLERFLDELPR